MTAYAVFLRGVSPMNCKMAALRACLSEAGYRDVETVLSSGNAVLDAPARAARGLEARIEARIEAGMGRRFLTVVRTIDELRALLDADRFAGFRLPRGAKRVVTFLRDAPGKTSLPGEIDGARILGVFGREVLSAYVPSPRGAVFMNVIEKTFGGAVTTRTWDTVQKVAARRA